MTEDIKETETETETETKTKTKTKTETETETKTKTETETKTKTKLDLTKAKDNSLLAKIFAVLLVVVCHVLMWLGILKNATSQEIIACAATVVGIFATVDINIFADKFAKKGD